MKKNLAFIAVILALAIWSAMLHLQTKRQSEEIEKGRQLKQEVEALHSENAELKQFREQAVEVERSRKEHGELMKLRNEVGTLRTEKQKLTAELKQAGLTIAIMKDNLQRPVSPPPGQISGSYQLSNPVAVQNACINNLRLIDGAMQQWALEYKKTADDIPTQDELLLYLGGPGRPWPICPGGGSYILGAVKNPPRCSLPGHMLP